MNAGSSITSSTYIRRLDYGTRRKLSDFLDPQDAWKQVLVSIKRPSGEPRYSQLHVRRYEGLVAQGRSPTLELLNDLGTTNCTVGELVEILKSHILLAPASLLLPDAVKECSRQQDCPEPRRADTTRVCPGPQTDDRVCPGPQADDRVYPGSQTDDRVCPGSQTDDRVYPGPQTDDTTRVLETDTGLSHPMCPAALPSTPPNIPSVDHDEPSNSAYLTLPYKKLVKITGNFDERPLSDGGSRLGEGGFGTVYKGFIHDRPVAVKRLNADLYILVGKGVLPFGLCFKRSETMDDISLDELRMQYDQEIQTLRTLQHENLVDLVGFSCDSQHPCLVYAYMANGSLLDRLACLDESPPLCWRRRCLIAVGTARGLDYLHSNHHIHRDVKSGNILLNEDLVPKISDFGLTRASAKHSSTTMMTQRIVGTRAYMAPEALRGEITPKSDIFSFGVVLLEILSGLGPVDVKREPQFLMELRYDIEDEDEDLTLEDFVDEKMRDWELVQVERFYSLACSCLNDRKARRPDVTKVLKELEEVVRSILLERQVTDEA